jgi:aminodeoxyfutalosine synthase
VLEKIESQQRIDEGEALALYQQAELPLLGFLANHLNFQRHKKKVFFNRNIHIEPTNICLFRCKFCSFSRDEGHPEAWDFSRKQMEEMVKKAVENGATEVHVVGGVHPQRDVHWYAGLIADIRSWAPAIHIKAFTAIELRFMFGKAGMNLEQGFKLLKDAGLNSIPGGGAEILVDEVRSVVCPEKGKSALWLEVHEASHKAGIPSNATMLYGHIEKPEHRIQHMSVIRNLQDKTGLFNTFIPLKYRNYNNALSGIQEMSYVEDLKLYALSRIFLDNIPHLKAYWPMTGKSLARMLLSFGADDLDGTIADTTKIYSMAGAEERNPGMTAEEIIQLISDEGFIPVERDSEYRTIKEF